MSLKAVCKTLLASAAFAVLFAGQANAQAVLTGRVVDADGAPVAFAEVAIERLNVATATEVDGTYRLLVPAARVSGQRETVVARALGYRSQTLEITMTEGELALDFTLALDPLRLEGVVATGQALSLTRERLGYTVDTVEAEEIVQSNETNIVSALAGKAPGVWVTSTSGEAGAGSFINIRGWKTNLTDRTGQNSTNQPLMVVDGTPFDNSGFSTELNTVGATAYQNRGADLNPEDIETIEILKGPAATSIYGSAGANGVILITTKQGQRGVTRFTGKVSYTWDDVNQNVPLQTRYGRGRDGTPVGQPGVDIRPSPTELRSWGLELDCYPNCVVGQDVFDHAGEVFRTGHQAKFDLSLSGGGDRTTYFLSGSYLSHEGVITGNNELDRWSVRLKATQWIRDNLSVSGNFAYTNQQGDLIQQGSNTSGLLLAAFRTVPEFNNLPWIDPESGLQRSYTNPSPTPGAIAESGVFDNPFFVANEILNQTDVGRTFGNVRLDWQALDWLNASWIVGADYANDDRFVLFPKSSAEWPDGAIYRTNARTFDLDQTLLLTGEHRLNENISGSLSLGYNMRQEETVRNLNQGVNLVIDSEQLDFTVDRLPNEYSSKIRTDGFFADLNVDLLGQLYLSGRIRNEGWSTFGPEADSRFTFGSVAGSWTFTKFLNLDPDHWLSFGKARVAYGTAGRAPNPFMNLSSFTVPTYGDGWLNNGLETVYLGLDGVARQAQGANEAIEPEKTTEFEAGLELAFLNSRVSFTGAYYYDKTTDAIVAVPVAPSTGFNTQPRNGAEFDNRGWEFSLDVIPFQRENFSWEIGGIWSTNESKVLDLLGAERIITGGFANTRNMIGYNICGVTADQVCPFGALLGRDFIRFGRGIQVDVDGDGTTENIDEVFSNAPVGALYIAADGFPRMDPQQRYNGDPNPDWLASLRNTFRIYRNLRVSFLLDFKKGGDTWNGTKGALFSYGTHKDSEVGHGAGLDTNFSGYGPGDPDGDGQGIDVNLNWNSWYVNGLGGGFNGPSSQFIEDSGYTKLRDVSVTYAFDQPWVNQIGFNTIEVTLSGRNLKTWTDYGGLDPETNLRGAVSGRGLEYFNHPQSRSWILTFNFIR